MSWIWGKVPRKINEFRLFRREFHIEKVPSNADLWCFAESHYKVYLNGEFIQCGPALCRPDHRLLDKHDVLAFLRRGKNCVAFEVNCPGIMSGEWTLTTPGLLAVLKIDGKNIIQSDSSWMTKCCGGWRHPTQLNSFSGAFAEWCVMKKMPKAWKDSGFDDSKWNDAVELPFFAHGNTKDLGENYSGYSTLRQYRGTDVVATGLKNGHITEKMREDAASHYTAVRNRWQRMMGKWNLKDNNVPLDDDEPMPEPIAFRAALETATSAPINMIEYLQTDKSFPVKINTPENNHPFIIVDLGIVRSGMLTLDIESSSGGTVDICYGDKVKDMHVTGGVSNCDRVEVAEGRVRWESFFQRGARYLQVILRQFQDTVTIHGVGIRETLTPIAVEQPAVFESDNNLLNDIWKTSVNTTRLYMNGCAYGDPIRERVHWFGDDSMSMRMAFYCFGEWKTWRRALELLAEAQRSDGSFPVISPGNFEDFNLIIGSCYWAIEVAEYFNHTNDMHFAEQMLSHINRHIEYELGFADAEGLLFETAGRRFLSWADGEPRLPFKEGEMWTWQMKKAWGDFFSPPTRGYIAIINTYWLWCLRTSAELCKKLGQDDQADRYQIIFDKALQGFEAHFWVPEKGLYRDNVCFDRNDKANEPTYCESTLFTLMRAGMIEKDKGLSCLKTIMAPDFVCNRTAGGFELGSLPVFLLGAGQTDSALRCYLDCWGEPVKAGATTSPEMFHSVGSSDCHIHGATPARDFLEFLAGIRIKKAGWQEILFVPPTASPLLGELRAEIPISGSGRICVEIKKVGEGKFLYSYEFPKTAKGFIKIGSITKTLTSNKGEIYF